MRRFRGLWVLCGALLLGGCADRGHPKVADGRLSVDQTVNFVTVAVHAGREEVVTLTNVGRGTVNILEVSTLGPPDTFEARFNHPGPHSLITGGDCEVAIRYTPRTGEQH